MPGLFGMGVPATAAVAAVALAALVVSALPSGRAALSALVGSVARWPSLIRAELRGAAPLRVDGPGDVPAVGRAELPVVQRPDRA